MAPAPKVLIAGTGRAGTTLLVQLLTELGLDTGYRPLAAGGGRDQSRDYFEHCSAGLERDPLEAGSPRIVKNPEFCRTLPALLATGRISVEHVLVPIRELEAAAESRVRVGGEGDVPGGLWGTSDPAAQKAVLAENFHGLMHTLAERDIPHTLLPFPRFARDPAYAFSKLRFLAPSLEYAEFQAAFSRVSRPEMIHDFAGEPAAEAGRAVAAFLRAERRKRLRRRAKRLLLLAAVLAVAALAARFGLERAAGPAPRANAAP